MKKTETANLNAEEQAQRAEDAAKVLREAEAAAKLPPRVAEQGDGNMELVALRIPLNPAAPEDTSVTVGLNGKLYQIKRGVTVQVPKAVVEIIEHSEEQRQAAFAYMAANMG